MKVHITATPDVDRIFHDSIVEYLKSVGDTIDFRSLGQMDYIKLEFINKKFKNREKVKNLSFTEIFNLVNYFRVMFQIKEEDYVILLTNISNNKEWYSAFDKNNIFVNCSELKGVLGDKLIYGIAYQCIENIFQSLIHLDINKYLSEPNIHFQPVGCINDYCDEESQVLIKLQTGNICGSCYDRALKYKVDELVLNQIIQTCENIRKEFVVTKRIRELVNPDVIRIDKEGNIFIGDKNIKLQVIFKTIMIFFLKHPEGIPTKLIEDYEEELFSIYKKLRKGADRNVIKNMCGLNKNNDEPLFEQKRSKLKKYLKEQLPDPLYSNYIIKTIRQQNDINLYKIDLESKYIEIDPKF